MKKIFAGLIAICLLLTGCGNGDYNKAKEYLIEEYHMTQTETVPKVILDCDMTYLGDDAI